MIWPVPKFSWVVLIDKIAKTFYWFDNKRVFRIFKIRIHKFYSFRFYTDSQKILLFFSTKWTVDVLVEFFYFPPKHCQGCTLHKSVLGMWSTLSSSGCSNEIRNFIWNILVVKTVSIFKTFSCGIYLCTSCQKFTRNYRETAWVSCKTLFHAWLRDTFSGFCMFLLWLTVCWPHLCESLYKYYMISNEVWCQMHVRHIYQSHYFSQSSLFPVPC